MKNKIGLKKAIIVSLIIIVIALILIQTVMTLEYKKYTFNFNNKLESIILVLQSKYPKLEKDEIIEIINSENNNNSTIFKEYGIDINNDSAILLNNKLFIKFTVVNLGLIIILTLNIILIFIIYNNSKDKKLKEITKYIEEINNKNYKLDIDDNSEDELSILKNEIYKTTVMLKEVAENSKQEKVNLKDSLSDISHQLKTPLTSISIMVDNIMDNPNMDVEIRQDFVKDIRREIINISFLVNTLLKLSKLDANSVNFINQKNKVEEIVKEAVKNVEILCDLKNIEIITNGNNNMEINCDLKWQVEAITNILKNCVEHSEENKKIYISYEENNVYAKIEIKDQGKGIDKEDLPHIFERFYKGKNSSAESVGIGLALAKSIIESNNGYIGVESKINEGSTFVIKYFK